MYCFWPPSVQRTTRAFRSHPGAFALASLLRPFTAAADCAGARAVGDDDPRAQEDVRGRGRYSPPQLSAFSYFWFFGLVILVGVWTGPSELNPSIRVLSSLMRMDPVGSQLPPRLLPLEQQYLCNPLAVFWFLLLFFWGRFRLLDRISLFPYPPFVHTHKSTRSNYRPCLPCLTRGIGNTGGDE